jgi:hypothetical protein
MAGELRMRSDRVPQSPDEALRRLSAVFVAADHQQLLVATRWIQQRLKRRDLGVGTEPPCQPSDRGLLRRCGRTSAAAGVDDNLSR